MVPGTPETIEALINEAHPLWQRLYVSQSLSFWSDAMRLVLGRAGAEFGSNAVYLIELDVGVRTTNIRGWAADGIAAAHQAYHLAELENANLPKRSAVLVSADSMQGLKDAFPSYYGDTKAFVNHVNILLGVRDEEGGAYG